MEPPPPPPPLLSPDGRYWWNGSAWLPYTDPHLPWPPAAAPIRLTSWRADRKGIDIWFADTTVASVASLLNRFLLSWGLRFDRGTAGDGRYSNHAGLARQQSYTVTVSEHMGSIHVVVARTMSSGANHKRLIAGLAAFLGDPRQLQQSALVSAAPLAVQPGPALPQQTAQKGNSGARAAAAVLVLAFGVIAFFIFSAALKNSRTADQSQSDASISSNGSDPAASSGPAPNCVPSNDGSQAAFPGYDFHKYVDSTSTDPCWAHWNITLGPGCQYFLDSQGPYAAPSNVWNIRLWGYGYGNTVAKLDDGHWLLFTCKINSRGEPQITLHDPDWS